MKKLDFREKQIQHLHQSLTLRLVNESDIPELRVLVNTAYKELADRGLNYTATYQDEEKTRQRVHKGRAFVLVENKKILATILFSIENHFTQRHTAYVGQFAVLPEYKKKGLGTILLEHCEKLAKEEGFEGIQLDTAIPATHLVNWYMSRGYQIVGEIQWPGKTYRSYFLEFLF